MSRLSIPNAEYLKMPLIAFVDHQNRPGKLGIAVVKIGHLDNEALAAKIAFWSKRGLTTRAFKAQQELDRRLAA